MGRKDIAGLTNIGTRFRILKRRFIAFVCASVLMILLTSCARNSLPKNDSDVDTIFEQDYNLLEEAVSLLLSMDEAGCI